MKTEPSIAAETGQTSPAGSGRDSPAVEPSGCRPGKRARRTWPKKLAAIVLGLVVGAFVIEFAVLLLLGSQVRFPRHVVEAPWGLRYNQPGAQYRHRSADGIWEFHINQQGMRADRDFTYAKPPGTRRIVSLGDSFAIGYEADVEECFSSVLERKLIDRGFRAEVLNAGVSGFSNAEECLYLERELLKYDPDVVLISFFSNDLVDNFRTGLFQLKRQGGLAEWNDRYIPLGNVANFLNTSRVFGFLSERSNAFALVKERATLLVKGRMVEENVERVASSENKPASTSDNSNSSSSSSTTSVPRDYPQMFAAAVFERIYQTLHGRNIPLVIHSIPAQVGGPNGKLVDDFPLNHFDVHRPGIHFLAAKDVLEPSVGEQQLYRQRSHHHWSPFSHDAAGTALAELIAQRVFLEP